MSAFSKRLLTYPLPREEWADLIAFWQAEWAHTDVDWLEALRGAYADSLTIQLAVATCRGEIVGTASVYYPRISPEVCCMADVLTHPKMRGRGIAATLTETAVQSAFSAGCRAAFLGNEKKPRSVYEKVGFRRIHGGVMRRVAPGEEHPEAEWYARGQRLSVRETVWADLPGMACLLAQPLNVCFADYLRGLASARVADPARCVSNFTTVWNEVSQRGGKMLTLVGESPHRVLGFGTLTPEPGAARAHRAVIEATAHGNYDDNASLLIGRLLAEARVRNLRAVQAYTVESDRAKIKPLRKAGFRTIAKLPGQVGLAGRFLSVLLWHRRS